MQKIPGDFAFPLWIIFREFSAHCGDLSWNCPSRKILPGGCGVVRCPGSGMAFVDVDNNNNDAYEEDYKDDKDEDDEDDNDKNENEDEFEAD